MINAVKSTVFDYRLLRFIMGLIAFSLPIVVSILSSNPLSSISSSYYTEGRDAFVGMLFIVGSFLFAYNGHTTKEALASKIAAIAAIIVALFPTNCDTCDSNFTSYFHYSAATLLFSILTYFCLGPFQTGKRKMAGKTGRRMKIYSTCGTIMILCILTVGIANIFIPSDLIRSLHITYWAEAIALEAFGFAWIVAGKLDLIGFLVEPEDALKIL